MEIKPLKNKKILNLSNINFNTNRFYKDKDILSAVNWLKEEINNWDEDMDFMDRSLSISKKRTTDLIDKAFQDVLTNSKRGISGTRKVIKK